MKKITVLFSMFILLILFIFSGCNNNSTEDKKANEKITDIPASTKSTVAMASFQDGMAFLDLGDNKKARASFDKSIEQDPQFGLCYLMRASTSRSAKEFADDIASAKSKMDSASSWEKMYADYMSTNLTGERNKGIEILQKIAADYPDAARAQVNLGNGYAGNNQFDKSREAFLKAIQMDPSNIGAHNALIYSYLFNEPLDLKKAEEYALKLVSLAPKSSGAEITLGDVYRAQNDFQKAKDAYAKAVELDASLPEGYYKLGHANTYLGNLEEARKNYSEAGMHDDINTGAVLNSSYTYLYANDTKAAVKYLFDELAKLNNSSADASQKTNQKSNILTTIATIAIHSGDAATLKSVVSPIIATSKQISIDLGNTKEIKIYEDADSVHWQAMVLMTEGKLEEAKAAEESMKSLLDPIKDDRKLETFHEDMGRISMKQKNYTEAISHFEKTNPNSIYNKYLQAKANEAAGNKDKSIALYKEVLAYNFNGIDNALIRTEVKKILGTP